MMTLLCIDDNNKVLAAPYGRFNGDLERVRFAGEGTCADDIGTVHGAWMTGEREAAAVLGEWDEQDCAQMGSGHAVEVELRALQARASIVDQLRAENDESSSSGSSSESSSDDY
jgi:hypothetical protein